MFCLHIFTRSNTFEEVRNQMQ